MRKFHLFAFCIFGCAALLLFPAPSIGQGGFGGGGKKKGGGSFGGGAPDANQLFDYYAGGKPYVLISDVKFNRDKMLAYAQEKGISNGQLTRPQFADYFDQSMKARAAGGFSGGTGGSNKGGKTPGSPDEGGGMKKMKFEFPGAPGSGITVSPGSAAPVSIDIMNQLADAQFKKLDRDGDGKLNQDEMPGPLRGNLGKWDKNNDGFINQDEFREFFSARMVGNGEDPATRNIATIIIEVEELDRKPVVFRAGGAMPAGLPGWFKELDTDKDGQVGLYEWRKGSSVLEKHKIDPDLDEFRKWDLNDDGFITPEEALRFLAQGATPRTAVASASGSSSGDRPSGGKGNPWSGFGGKGFGGKGKKGDKSDRP